MQFAPSWLGAPDDEDHDEEAEQQAARLRPASRQNQRSRSMSEDLLAERDELLQANEELEAENERLKQLCSRRSSKTSAADPFDRLGAHDHEEGPERPADLQTLTAREMAKEVLRGLFPLALVKAENSRMRDALETAQVEVSAVLQQFHEAWRLRGDALRDAERGSVELDTLRLQLVEQERRNVEMARRLRQEQDRAATLEIESGRQQAGNKDTPRTRGAPQGSLLAALEPSVLASMEAVELGWQGLKRLL